MGTEGTRRTPSVIGERAAPMPRRASVMASPRVLNTWLTALGLFLLALLPRTVAVGRFLTVDEAYHWLDRTDAFVKALRSGKYIETFQTGHPGVTVMWLGSAGVWLHERLARAGLVAGKDEHVHLQLLRLPLGIAAALCIALAYPLMRRLFGGRVALLAAILWATEPFIVAHAQLLHLDSTLTSLITLTLLLAMMAFGFDVPADAVAPPIRWHYLLGASLTTGLAFLTKSPSLILLPMVGLIALVGIWRVWPTNDQRPTINADGRRAVGFWPLVLRRGAFPLVAWGIAALAVWFVLWPALWVDLFGTVEKVLRQAEVEGGSPHAWGNFFWGQTVVDPGPLFYPVVVPFRLTPWASAGVVLFALFGGWHAVAWVRAWRSSIKHQASSIKQHAPSIILIVFVLVFSLIMTISPKKFDRYVLPIFPSLMILAAIGWIIAYDWIRRVPDNWRSTPTKRGWAACHGTMLLLGVVNLLWFHPYELAYFNQALGGGPTAERTVPIGWGEVYEQAGAYIMAQPDGRDYPVAVRYGPLLEPYIDVPAVPLNWAAEPGKAGYAILYIDETQRSNIPPEVTRALETMRPIHTVQVHGIDYAHIYQLPQPVATPHPADFGAALHLRGYDLDAGAVRSSGALTLTLHWLPSASLPDDYTLFVHVLDASGNKIGGADLAPGRAGRPTSTWQANHYMSATYTIPVRGDASSGTYWVAVGLYDPRTGARVTLRAAPTPNAPDDGSDALLLGTFHLP